MSRDHVMRVMWFYAWESLMLSHHPAKFVGHRHCGSGDIMFLVAEEENCRCSCFNPHIILLTPILVTRTQSSNRANIWKRLCQFCPKAPTRKRMRRKKRKGNCKHFVFYAKRNYQYQMLLSSWTSKVKTSKLAL